MLRDPLPHAVVDGAGRALVEPDTESALGGGAESRPRQCGRCRLMFDGDPTLYRPARPDWWVCSPCRALLFGHTDANGGARRRRTGDTS